MLRFISLLILVPQFISAQSALTIPQIMQGEEFVGHLPEDVQWAANGESFYFHWKDEEPGVKPLYEYNLSTNAIQALSTQEEAELIIGNTISSFDNQYKLINKSGDLFLFTAESQSYQRITNTLAYESGLGFNVDASKVIYTLDDNIFTWEISTGAVSQITDFKSGDKKEEKQNPEDQWLERDQLALFDVLAERKLKTDNQKKREEALKDYRPKTIYIGSKNIRALQLSPDEKYVYYQLQIAPKAKMTDNMDFVTQDGHSNILKDREKVGYEQESEELWIYAIAKDTVYQVKPDQIPGIYDKPAFLKLYEKDKANFETKYDKPREVLFHGPDLHQNGKALVEIKAQDNKDRWLMLLNPEDASLKLIDRQHDDAWVGGPGISGWNMVAGNKGWLKDGQRYWFQSEASGYSHIYIADVVKGKKKALTKGKYEIHEAALSLDDQSFYVTSNEADPGERQFYKIDIKSGDKTRLTKAEGNHEVSLSPDEKWIVSRFSTSNQPWELFLAKNEPNAEFTQLTESTTEAFQKYDWRSAELVYFKAEDGADVRARIYKPESGKMNKGAVIFVHGAGYLQNAHKWWSSYYREYMFHNFLTDQGYTVLDIDYRASEGYGRDWRTAIYRHMGGKDLSDQVDGAAYLVKEHGIDSDKIGIYGGSYGGFITLMGLFTSPETFACGAAIRSVTDWAHYNHPYTSNILNTPIEDSLAFRKSSPIYFAEGLNKPLVMLHGAVDTNVQFQDIIRLNQRLIELGKKDWDLAVYPVEPHGFKEASSWTDEYGRIFDLFEKNLR